MRPSVRLPKPLPPRSSQTTPTPSGPFEASFYCARHIERREGIPAPALLLFPFPGKLQSQRASAGFPFPLSQRASISDSGRGQNVLAFIVLYMANSISSGEFPHAKGRTLSRIITVGMSGITQRADIFFLSCLSLLLCGLSLTPLSSSSSSLLPLSLLSSP